MKQISQMKILLFLLGILFYSQTWAQDHSLNFDGIKDYVQWGDPHQGSPGPYATTTMVHPLVGSDFTIELWMKSELDDWPPNTTGVLFAFNMYSPTHASNRLIFGLDGTGRLYIHDGDNTGLSTNIWTSTQVVADGLCHHIAFTHDISANECYVYIDGIEEDSPISTQFRLRRTDVFNIGQEWDNLDGLHNTEDHEPSQFYHGDMDDIRIWTKKREEIDIFNDMNTVFPLGEPDLWASFNADQGTAGGNNTLIPELVNNTVNPGLNGELVDFTRLTNVSNFILDPCAPCIASTDTSFIHINEDITIDVDAFWDNKYYIDDYVTVRVTNGAVLDITNVDVVFGECAGIVVDSNAYLRINNSVLRPCRVDGTWKGITFNAIAGMENSNSSIINETTFKHAEVALFFNGQTDAVVSNNLFSNCNYGVRVENNQNFKHAISGNRFVTENFYPTYSSCHEFVDNLSAYGIWANRTNFAQHISQNEFINSNGSSLPMVTGISQGGGASTSSSNLFTDMLHAFVVNEAAGYTSIINNNIEVNYPSSASIALSNVSILIDGTNGPLTEVNNNRIVNNENQILAYAAIGLKASSNISIATNDIEGFDRGITALDAHNCQITENTISNSSTVGIYFQQLPGPVPSPSFITCNTIKMKNYAGAIGIYIQDMERANEISSNCILDCATSIYLEGFGGLPKIRNNYLYNYTNIGIDVRNYGGDIGIAPSDPGMNTFWSNDNSAFDIHSFPTNISVADNFGMYNLSLATVVVTSANPYHSTASCGHQIFGSPSQGNLNPAYICDHKTNLNPGLQRTEAGYELAPDYSIQLSKSPTPFTFIKRIIGTVETLPESSLNSMIASSELDFSEEALLRYAYYLRNSDLVMAEASLNSFSPSNEEQELFKKLRLMNLKVLQANYSVLNAVDIALLERVVQNRGDQANFAIHLLNGVNNYTDYIFDMPDLVASAKPSAAFNLDIQDSYLKLYPNPAVSSITVELEVSEEGDVLQLIDITGQVLKTASVDFIAGITVVDISDLAQGIYFVVLTNPESGVKQREKVVKMGR